VEGKKPDNGACRLKRGILDHMAQPNHLTLPSLSQ
jgi:hypothetical protein